MTDANVETTITGGQIQGIAAAGTVHIENFTIYNRAIDETVTVDAIGEPIPPSPYPGLAYFGPGEADLFFGRDAAIARLAEAVGRQSLTALVGASGSGKSSVVLAGLAPQLHRTGKWEFSYFRIGHEPSRDPFLALPRALVPLFVDSEDETEKLVNTRKLSDKLRSHELPLGDVFAACRHHHQGRRVLFVADQFEECFTLVENQTVRSGFIDLLIGGFPDPTNGTSPDICLIVTLRADFYGRALRHRPLADALQGHIENLGPMNRKELEAAIVKPAESLGVSFAPGLVHRILEDVTRAPGGLPLLQFALREIWGSQQNGQITSESYDMIGGVDGAVAARAEAVYHKLTALDEQPPNPAKAQVKRDFQRLFTRLVALGEGQVDTRRVVSRDELGTAWALAERLAGEDNRLVVTSALDLPPERRTDDRGETVEIAHEALIRHWPRLVEWIKGDRNFQAWLTQIRPYTNVWLSNPSDSAPLLRGGMLAQAEDWFNSRRDDLSAAERNYVQASLDLRSEEERQRHAEMEAKIGQERALAEAATQLAEAQAVQHEQALKYAETQRAHAEFERQRALAQSFVDRRRSYIAIFAGLLSIIFLSLFAFGGFALKF